MLPRGKVPGAPGAGLDVIVNEQHAVLPADGRQILPESFGAGLDAVVTEHRGQDDERRIDVHEKTDEQQQREDHCDDRVGIL